ncbi:hypothetical protein ACIODW_22920 [Streptomyces sp. NPDC087897]
MSRWTLDGRVLTAGVVQHDTDLPVVTVVAPEQPAPSPTGPSASGP